MPRWACGYEGTVVRKGDRFWHVRLDPNEFDSEGRMVAGEAACFRWLATYPPAARRGLGSGDMLADIQPLDGPPRPAGEA